MNIMFFDHKVEKFIVSLEKPTIAKLLRTIDLLEKFGDKLRMPHSKPLKSGLFELRIRGVQEIRMLYCFHQGKAVILHGFVKNSNRILQKEFKVATEKKISLD